jgi:hypothetical protein
MIDGEIASSEFVGKRRGYRDKSDRRNSENSPHFRSGFDRFQTDTTLSPHVAGGARAI